MTQKPPAPRTQHIQNVELVISTLLRVGVVVSLAIVIAGLVLSFAHHREYWSSPSMLKQITTPGRVVPHGIGDVVRGMAQMRGEAVIALGLLLLIATPVLRVAVSIAVFVIERDWVFVVVTAFVLAMLILSFFLGGVEG
jgi:uncharacterized membrane protein